MSREGQEIGSSRYWHVCLCVVALTTGSPSSRLLKISSAVSPAERRERTHCPSFRLRPNPQMRATMLPLIVITGSRIPRTDLTAVSPVTMVKGYEFRSARRDERRRGSQLASAGQSIARRVRFRRRDRCRHGRPSRPRRRQDARIGQRPSPHAGRSALSRCRTSTASQRRSSSASKC